MSRSIYTRFWHILRSMWICRFFNCWSGECDEVSFIDRLALISQYGKSLQETLLSNEPEPEDLAYNMDHWNRGIAMIFNQRSFRDSENKMRIGSDRDRNRLENVLKKKLQFRQSDIRVFQDFETEKIKKELKEVADMDHTNNDCLLITIMTHGKSETLTSYNGNFPLELITDYFTDARCPTLKGKPRIFLIQSCRGKNETSEADSSFHVENNNNNTCDDFLIVRSTMPGCKSYRDKVNGSWFIQQFCIELETSKNKKTDLLRLLGQVNIAVNNNPANDTANKRQTLSISAKPRKAIIFDKKPSDIERVKRNMTEVFKIKKL